MNENAASPTVRIIWHGHSCFELQSAEANVVIDPYQEVPGYRKLDLRADLVLTSHEHGDHNARERVTLSGGEPKVNVEVIDTFHDAEGGRRRGKNKIHVITLAGKRIAHLGDLGHSLSPAQLERLRNLDVMLIPIGGYYTIDADQAAEIVRQTHPDVVVPMHYREGAAGFDVISTAEPFLKHFDQVVRHPEPSFALGEVSRCVLVLKNPKQ